MTIEITDFIEDKSVDLELIASFSISKIEKLWNLLQIRGVKPESERDIALRLKCIEVLEKLYRKPWDENSKKGYSQIVFFILLPFSIFQIDSNARGDGWIRL